MRAIYYPFDNSFEEKTVTITGDSAHHLFVVRVKTKEEILLINGMGARLQGEVGEISKTSVEFKIHSKKLFTPEHNLSLAIAMPKKEAFEDILKMTVELGVREIHPLTSHFSQYDYKESERVQRLLESALVQSNNPFFPLIHPQQKLKDFLSSHQEELVFFNSQKSHSNEPSEKKAKKTILIGPEGGFSPEEIAEISHYHCLFEIHLPTPILRAPTAVASAIGYLLASS